jgi:hypothetical protein
MIICLNIILKQFKISRQAFYDFNGKYKIFIRKKHGIYFINSFMYKNLLNYYATKNKYKKCRCNKKHT